MSHNYYPNDVVEFDDRRLPQAIDYVAHRFYPPLPSEYGIIGLAAVILLNNDERDARIILPDTLDPLPQRAYVDGNLILIDPRWMIDALRLWHMIDDTIETDGF